MEVSKAHMGCVSAGLSRASLIFGLLFCLAHCQTTTAPSITSNQQQPTPTLRSAFSTYSAPSFTNPSNADSTTPPSNSNDDDGGIANYYYVFIAVVLVIVGLGVLLWNARRRNLKRRSRVRSQSALRQDLVNYQEGQRRWLHGMHWRENPALTRYQQGLRRQREEGLNERGEAPPPYIPEYSTAMPSGTPNHSTTLDGSGNEIAVPLEVLTRDGTALKPPDYSETLRPVYVDVRGNNRAEASPTADQPSATSSVPQRASETNNSSGTGLPQGSGTTQSVDNPNDQSNPPGSNDAGASTPRT